MSARQFASNAMTRPKSSRTPIIVIVMGVLLLPTCRTSPPDPTDDPAPSSIGGEDQADANPDDVTSTNSEAMSDAEVDDNATLAPRSRVTGFSFTAATTQLERERTFRRHASRKNCDEHLKRLAATPRLAGSKASWRAADDVAARFRDMGYQVEIEEYEVLVPYPVRIRLEMVAPRAFQAKIREPSLRMDADTLSNDVVFPFNAYAPDADITGPLVYANYGTVDDYRVLERSGVDVKDAILLIRYGRTYRGSKLELAERRGAAGVIFFSDPADDGYVQGDVYPNGPFRPANSVQRGSVLYTFRYPGDPGTPGRPSHRGADQPSYDDMQSLPAIPATCISAQDARPFLESLKGPTVPDGWQGGLPITYHMGDRGSVRVRLGLEMDYHLRLIRNTIATMVGLGEPDRFVLVGNHRDSWGHGAVDAASGTSCLLEAARLVAEASAAGEAPFRTIKFATWDGEEFGLLGSTEWGEDHADELRANCVGYVNLDAAVAGREWRAAGVPNLRRLVEELWATWPARTGSLLEEARGRDGRIPFPSLGAGSDYTVFLDHLGIPCLDLSSTGPFGVYHSRYDTYSYMKRIVDPDFARHAEVAAMLASLTTRLANASVLPYDYPSYGRSIAADAEAVEAKRTELDLAEIREIAASIATVGREIDQARRRLVERPVDIAVLQDLNARLNQAERKLLDQNGFAGRPWYRHVLFAPDPRVGYGSAPLAMLDDALQSGTRTRIESAATRTVAALRAFLAHLEQTRDAFRARLPKPATSPAGS